MAKKGNNGALSAVLWGAAEGARRVVRGGSWNNDDNNVRAANRNRNNPNNRNNNLGVRVVVAPQLSPLLAGNADRPPLWPAAED